jgi:hypothetical protein
MKDVTPDDPGSETRKLSSRQDGRRWKYEYAPRQCLVESSIASFSVLEELRTCPVAPWQMSSGGKECIQLPRDDQHSKVCIAL